MRLLFGAFLMVFAGCVGSTGSDPESEALVPMPDETRDSAWFKRQAALPEIQKQYQRALADYMDTVFALLKPDTLFISSVPNDADVQFPDEINGIRIAYWPGENAMQETAARRKSMIMLNVAGWVDSLQSEFIIVTFFGYAKPQHNLHLHYSRKTVHDNFTRDSLRFEYQYADAIPLETYLKKSP